VTTVAYVLRLVEDGLTLAAVRRVLQLEMQVRELEAGLAALRAAIDERDALIAALRPPQSGSDPAPPPGTR
jgi:hypothetical protein